MPTEPVIIKTQPDGAILREGDSLYLRVDAVGYPLPKYQWYKDGAKIPDEIFKDLKIDKVTMAMDGQYKCLVENKENSVYSHEVTVRVTRGENCYLHSKKQTTCSGLMKAGLNNVVLPTLFKGVNNTEQIDEPELACNQV